MKHCILCAEHLFYTYANGQPALADVSAELYEGERVAVIGPNGSGKSTFFLNLNGVYAPTDGKIVYRGEEVTKKTLNTLRQNVGIVFQDADNQIIASTVRAEVGFGPMNLRLPREAVLRRVDEALSYMNIAALADRPPHYLSGGEKKRVSIADIVAMRPEVFIFDEPTASLDPVNAQMLEEVLEKLGTEGKTLLISTHDVDFAYRWASRVLVFSQGRIVADAPPLAVFLDTELLKRANLKKPAMLLVYEALLSAGVLENAGAYPKTPEELKGLLARAAR